MRVEQPPRLLATTHCFQGGCMKCCNRSEEMRGTKRLLLRQSPARTFALALLVTIFVLISGRDGAAQVWYGSIVGTVTDSSGSVVPDAAVKTINIETNE